MSSEAILFSEAFLILGGVVGWIGAEKFIDYRDRTRHVFEDLFEENPHPEIYDDDGKINRGDYLLINFDPGYDPDEFDPEDIIEDSY
jgi:hypothetical protein